MKIKKLTSLVSVAAIISVFGVSAAHAEGTSISAVGAFNLSNLNGALTLGAGTPGFPNGNNVTTGTTVGFGLLADLGGLPGFGLQLGALYVPRKINYNDSSGTSQGGAVINSLEIPLLVRINLPIVSVGLGPYYAHTIGNGSLTVAGVSGDAPFDYGATNFSTSDFGLEGSVALNIPIVPSVSALLDGRYLFGLTNLDTSGATTTHFRDFQLLAGVTFGL